MSDNNEEEEKKNDKTPNKKRTKCYNCNKFGHLTFNCTLSKLNCHRCGLLGHYFWDCNLGPTNFEPIKEDEREKEGNGCVENRVDEIEVDPIRKGRCRWGFNLEKSETLSVELSDKDNEGSDSVVCVEKRVNEIEFDPMDNGLDLNLEKLNTLVAKLTHGGDKKNNQTGAVVCVKRMEDVKKVEEVEDCFILEFDPTKISKGVKLEEEEEDDDDDKGFKILSSIVSVKRREDVKKVEQVEDCFILEFDPDEPVKFNNLSLSVSKSHTLTVFEDDLSIVAEKGQVACRDFPHPRHLCAKYPFKQTSHSYYCEKCYCYICDIPAPCAKWTWIEGPMHCHANDEESMWKNIKQTQKRAYNPNVFV